MISLKVTDGLTRFHTHQSPCTIKHLSHTRTTSVEVEQISNSCRVGEEGTEYIFTSLDSAQRLNLYLCIFHVLYLHRRGTCLICIIHQKLVTPSYSLKISQTQNNIPYAIRSFYLIFGKKFMQFVSPFLILVFKEAVSPTSCVPLNSEKTGFFYWKCYSTSIRKQTFIFCNGRFRWK